MKNRHANSRTRSTPRVSLGEKMVLLRRHRRKEALRQLRRMGISISRLRRQWGATGHSGTVLSELLLPTEVRFRPFHRKPKHV